MVRNVLNRMPMVFSASPLFLSVPIARKIYGNEALQLMFDGHVSHSPEEVRQMIEDIIAYGIKYDIATPHLAKLKEII